MVYAEKTILVVEDDEATRAILVEQIENDLGLKVATASTLQDADRLLSDSSICTAVLLDVGMPDAAQQHQRRASRRAIAPPPLNCGPLARLYEEKSRSAIQTDGSAPEGEPLRVALYR